MIPMNDYVPLLKKQHDESLLLFQSLNEAWQKKDLSLCRVQMEKLYPLIVEHHETELKILFDKVEYHKVPTQGGPFCSYFFEFFMNNRPIVLAEKYISDLTSTAYKISIPPQAKSFFDSNSLISIPLEEHIAVQELAKALMGYFSLDKLTNENAASAALFYLGDVMSVNFKKEETCFWEVSKQVLGPQTVAEISALTSFDPASTE